MKGQIQYQFTPRLLLKAHFKLRLLEMGWHGTVALVFGVAFLGLLFSSPNEDGKRFAMIGSAILLTVLGLYALYYGHQFYQNLSGLKDFGDKPVVVEWDDEHLHFESALGTSDLKWNAVKKLRRASDFWFVYIPPTIVFVPTAAMTGEHQDMLLEKLKAAGVRIR